MAWMETKIWSMRRARRTMQNQWPQCTTICWTHILGRDHTNVKIRSCVVMDRETAVDDASGRPRRRGAVSWGRRHFLRWPRTIRMYEESNNCRYRFLFSIYCSNRQHSTPGCGRKVSQSCSGDQTLEWKNDHYCNSPTLRVLTCLLSNIP